MKADANPEGAAAPYSGRQLQMFPKLTPARISRLEAHGSNITTHAGEAKDLPASSRFIAFPTPRSTACPVASVDVISATRFMPRSRKYRNR